MGGDLDPGRERYGPGVASPPSRRGVYFENALLVPNSDAALDGEPQLNEYRERMEARQRSLTTMCLAGAGLASHDGRRR